MIFHTRLDAVRVSAGRGRRAALLAAPCCGPEVGAAAADAAGGTGLGVPPPSRMPSSIESSIKLVVWVCRRRTSSSPRRAQGPSSARRLLPCCGGAGWGVQSVHSLRTTSRTGLEFGVATATMRRRGRVGVSPAHSRLATQRAGPTLGSAAAAALLLRRAGAWPL